MEVSSDCESIRTEDFATKFTEILNGESKDSGFSCSKSERCLTPTITDPDSNAKVPTLDLCYQESTSNKDKVLLDVPQLNRRRQLDVESIATELFEDHFKAMFGSTASTGNDHNNSSRSIPAESCNTSLTIDVGNLSNVQPIRRDILNKFLAKYSLETRLDSAPIKTVIQSKHQLTKPSSTAHTQNNIGSTHNKQTFITNNELRPQDAFSDVTSYRSANRQYGALFKNKAALAEEIRAKSMRIQEEIHEERRKKGEGNNNNNKINDEHLTGTNNQPAAVKQQLDIKVRELDALTDRMRKARADREKLSAELNQLRSQVTNDAGASGLNTLPRSMSPSKQQQQQSNALRNHNTQNAMKSGHHQQQNEDHFVFLNQQLNQKKVQLQELESKIHERMREIQNLEAVGLSRKDIEQVIEERDELYEILRQTEEQGQTKYELEKQLAEYEELLKTEQNKSKQCIENLEQQLDNMYKKLNIIYQDKDQLTKDNEQMKETMKYREEEINELYYERNELRNFLDKAREEVETEKNAAKDLLNQEHKRFSSQLATKDAQHKLAVTDYKNQLGKLQDELENLYSQHKSFKSTISKLEDDNNQLVSKMDSRDAESKEAIQRVIEEYNSTVEKLKRDFYSSRETEIQSLKNEFDSEQMRTINNLRECYKQQVVDLQARLESKSQECQDLRGELRKLSSEYTDREESMRQQHEHQLGSLHKEHQRTIDSLERNRTRDFDDLKDKYDSLLTNIRSELDQETCMTQSLRAALDKANSNLTKEIEAAKKHKLEKNSAIHKLKELAKQKLVEESHRIKQLYEKELEDQLKTIEQVIEQRAVESTSRTSELERQYLQETSTLKSALQQLSNDFHAFIKEQSNDLVKYAKFHPPSYKSPTKSENLSDIRESIESAKCNFNHCIQEFYQYHKDNLEKMLNDHEESVKLLREKTQQDTQILRDQISKDHADEMNLIHANHNQELTALKSNHEIEIDKMKAGIKQWKARTAEKLANKLHKEFRKELERKSSVQGSSVHSYQVGPTNDTGHSKQQQTIGLIEDLRNNIRSLREENHSLRKLMSNGAVLPNTISSPRSPRASMSHHQQQQQYESSPRGSPKYSSSQYSISHHQQQHQQQHQQHQPPQLPKHQYESSPRTSPTTAATSATIPLYTSPPTHNTTTHQYKRPQSACPECYGNRSHNTSLGDVTRAASFKSFRA